MIPIYDTLVFISDYILEIVCLFSTKIKKLVQGRKESLKHIQHFRHGNKKVVWFHASSVGEFEQALPIIEEWKGRMKDLFVCVSFFSPSGYEQCSKNKLIDFAFYLPSDTKKNATLMLTKLKPQIIVFVKYDFWFRVLHEIKKRHIPLFLISAIFREEQIFFKRYGTFFRRMLLSFTTLFVQDEHSALLLSNIIDKQKIKIAGDTRYDRVLQLPQQKLSQAEESFFNQYTKDKFCIVLGSTLIDDEILFQDIIKHFASEKKICWICIPHSIHKTHIDKMREMFPQATLYSEIQSKPHTNDSSFLIVNTYGLLSRLYRFASIAYVGGGFTKHNGIHNILEPAVYNIPVVIGKYFQKHLEARELVARHLCFSASTKNELLNTLKMLVNDEQKRQSISKELKIFFTQKKGATQCITDHIFSQNLFLKPKTN